MKFDINRIVKWCETWSMGLSPANCKVIYLGKQLNPEEYFIAEKNIIVTECQRDFSVLVSSDDGTWYEQVKYTSSKTNRILGLSKNTFSS